MVMMDLIRIEVGMTTMTTMIKLIKDFAHRYEANITHRTSTVNPYCVTYGGLYDYNDGSNTVVSVEMPLHSFHSLVELYNHAEEESRAQRKEKYLRTRHPAVKDAYEQYQMLLALCK